MTPVYAEQDDGNEQSFVDAGRMASDANDVLHLILQQFERIPTAMAVVSQEQSLTYGELELRANNVAQCLLRKKPGPEFRVGIALPRCIDMLICLVGVMKAGGTFVPLSLSYPKERLLYIMRDASISALITCTDYEADLTIPGVQILSLETLAGNNAVRPQVKLQPEQLAYIIYTSGSTGNPKGVGVTHASLLSLVLWHLHTYALTETDRTTQIADFGFDASVWEIWTTLSAGASLYLPDELTRLSPALLHNWLIEQHITVSFIPTLLAEALMTFSWPQQLALRLLLTGGDKLHKYPPPNLPFAVINHYGPTECTVVATATTITDTRSDRNVPTIGRPITHAQVYILDHELHSVPPGTAGELCIAGTGLARGYIGNPALTAERFVPHPLSEHGSERLYRTGDLARFLPDGQIDFLGRIDQQVKIRGFRIETGEIEANLMRHFAVQDAIVQVRDDPSGEPRLVAYLIAQDGVTPKNAAVRAFLRQFLPSYMVPSIFVWLNEYPVNAHGKVDLHALPEPVIDINVQEPLITPLTVTEQRLARLWSSLLGAGSIERDDNFFELGGHSLLAIRLVSAIQDTFAIHFSFSLLFRYPILSAMAQYIEQQAQTTLPEIIGAATLPDGFYPLSSTQLRFWTLHQLDPESPLYNVFIALQLRGPLDPGALKHSLYELGRRHESLRTTFSMQENEPVQCISPEVVLDLRIVTVDELPATAPDVVARQLLQEDIRRPFDLMVAPLWRVTLVCCDQQTSLLLFNLHHIIADGWSFEVLLREFSILYQAYVSYDTPALPELPVHYRDFAVWQRHQIQDARWQGQISYWQQRLKNAPPLLDLPLDHPRPAVQTFRGAQQCFAIPQDALRAMYRLNQEEGVTKFTILFATWMVLLSLYSAQNDIIVGIPIANRLYANLDTIIGAFINSVAVRMQLTDGSSFRDILRQLYAHVLDAYEHQDIPFERVLEALHVQRDTAFSPLFQVMFVFQEDYTTQLSLPEITSQQLLLHNETAMFDLVLEIVTMNGELVASLQYNTDLFEASTIEGMVTQYLRLLSLLMHSPDQVIAELSLLSDADRQQMLVIWNATDMVYPQDSPLQQLIQQQAHRQPDAPAVISASRTLTYGELVRSASQLASYLRKHGVGPDVKVGVMVERSIEMAIGLVAILLAGGAYVPLDPAYPIERLIYILQDVQAEIVLTQTHLARKLKDVAYTYIYIDDGKETFLRERIIPSAVEVDANHLAYVVYTSGSTGSPKGVEVSHSSLLNFIHWHKHAFHLMPQDRVSQIYGFSFDAFAQEIWPTLAFGASLYIADETTRLSPIQLRDWFLNQGITIASAPTLLVEAMQQLPWPQQSAIRYLITGGDKLHCNPALAYPFTLVNHYGPTECTIAATVAPCVGEDLRRELPSIGKPLANVQIYVLDRSLRPVPIGFPGELYIGGAGIARGYHARPELTAERFIPNPFGPQPGSRLYCTGDRVRYLADGRLDFIGRADQQIKIHGFRVEVGDIEATLLKHHAIQQAIVRFYRKTRQFDCLVAYIVYETGDTATVDELRTYLQQFLPAYMLPTFYIELSALPMTATGKVDRLALPEPDWANMVDVVDDVAPRTALEATLADLYTHVLGLDRISIHSNFLEYGGNSLAAIHLVAQIYEAFHIELPVRMIFDAPTIAQLATEIEGMQQQSRLSPASERRLDAATAQDMLANFSHLSNEQIEELLSQLLEEESRILDE